MKKILPVLFLFGISLACYSQDPRVVKLEKELKQHPQGDTLRVNRLNELGRLKTLSPGALDTLADEVLMLSRKLNYPEGEVYGLVKKARVSLLKNDPANGLVIMNKAIAMAEKISDKTYLATVYNAMARFKKLAGDNKQALPYLLKAEATTHLASDKSLIARYQINLADFFSISAGNYPEALKWALKAEKTAEEANNLSEQAYAWASMAGIYTSLGDQLNSLNYYKKALAANKKLGNTFLETNILNHIGERYRLMGKYNEALKAYAEGLQKNTDPSYTELNESNMADVYVRLGNLPMAFKYGFKSLKGAKAVKDLEGEEWINGILARAYLKKNIPDSAIYYAQAGYKNAIKSETIEFKRDNSEALASAYAIKKDFPNAYKYHLLFISYRDSMLNEQVSNQTALLQYNYALAKKQAQIATLNQDKKSQRYFLIAAAVTIGLIVITLAVLFKNNRQKQKANILLSKQKQMIEEQRDETNKALGELQLTQKQLIQSEKMASLGELTAGIAHEIQNPLNFVNNFSEVNTELIDDLEAEINNGNLAEVNAIAKDIKSNQQKITQHGKRADFIVKGMLQHSRSSTGERQLTNINVLADEFLKLSYHGLRAKDKGFNAEMVTRFDSNLPKVNVVSQDIGRVLLNLFNNAFFAVNQKARTAEPDYKPTVTLSTFTPSSGGMGVKVQDNGNGIPDNIKEKIMQPFFTTKAAGEGTGLGLSISYDIVKSHGGKIVVDSKIGEGSNFTVVLPLK